MQNSTNIAAPVTLHDETEVHFFKADKDSQKTYDGICIFKG